MSVNLYLKVPDDVARALRNRAAYNQRSLQEEVLVILRQAVKDHEEVTLDTVLERAQRKKPSLDEQAARVRAAQDAERANMSKRFEDLLGGPGADSGERSGDKR